MNKDKAPLLSVCLPSYEMGGVGDKFLRRNLDILVGQTFKDFDVVITDNSSTDLIKNVCDEYKGRLDIKYYKNDHNLGMSGNVNAAIKKATGKIAKILCQDDFLYKKESLEEIVKNFDPELDHWMVTACKQSRDGVIFFRPFYPRYNKNIHLGNNTISGPSVLTIRNKDPLLFDENLSWLMDCDYYRRCYEKFGLPKILNEINSVNGIGEQQSTSATKEALKRAEYQYVAKKFSNRPQRRIKLDSVTLVAATGSRTEGAIKALQRSMEGIDFYQAVLIAHHKPDGLDPRITFKQCKPTELASQDPKNASEYAKFILHNLSEYIESDFALIVNSNAYVIRPEKWTDTFLEYDYIGAPWAKDTHFTNEGVNIRVGNGGFSLRSKKLLRVIDELKLSFADNDTGLHHEDEVICVRHRKELENYGIRFAPVEVASTFSHEKNCNDSDPEPFGFHKNKNVFPISLRIRDFWGK